MEQFSTPIPTQAEITAYVQQQIQAALQAQPPVPPQPHVSIKPSAPKPYSGQRNSDPEVWLFQFEQYARLLNMTDEQKVDYAAVQLEGPAATWWRSVVVVCERTNTPKPIWPAFKQQLITLFKPVDSAKVARDQLADLKQTGSVSKYNAEFMQLVLEAGNVDANEQLHRYVRGLKPKIRVEIELSDPRAVHEAMEKAQRIDTITWHAHKEYNSNWKSHGASNSSSYAPMDLSAIKQQASEPEKSETVNAMNNQFNRPRRKQYAPAMSKEEYERCRREGLCLQCKKPGHTARFCLANTSKPKQQGKGSTR